MGRKKLSMSEKVRRFYAANPDAKPREVAAKLDIPLATVYASKPKHKPVPAVIEVLEAKPINIDAVHEKMQPKAIDLVEHPAHYTDGGIETIDFLAAKLTKEEFVGYLKGNVLKYGSRLGKKGDIEVDAGKMAWYATKLRDVLNVRA